MDSNAGTVPSDTVTIRSRGIDARHHSLVIVSGARPDTHDLESILETATRRGLDKIASELRHQISERDDEILRNALAATDRDFALSGALVQFAVEAGVLRCRAFVELEDEAALISALDRIPGVHRIAVDVVIPPKKAQG
jgi:hypothetical protein